MAGFFVVIVGLALLLTSCTGQQGSSLQASAQGSKSGDTSKSGPEGRPENEAVLTGDEATYLDGIPFAQYPGSTVTLSINKSAELHKSVNLETGDEPIKVVAYYRSWFKDNGWKVLTQSHTAGLEAVSAEKGKELASIMSMPGAGSSGQNTIQITVSRGN